MSERSASSDSPGRASALTPGARSSASLRGGPIGPAPSGKAYMASMAELFSSREMKALHDDAPTPLYFQLFTLLKNRILNGSIPHGEQMPTEEELAKGFGGSRITAKRALDDLAAAELVERRRGKGTFVTYSAARDSVHAPLVGELEKLANLAQHTRVEVLDVGQQLPPGDVSAEMGLERGELAWRASRIRRTEDNVPYGHLISWTIGISKGYTKRELERRVRLDILKDNGIEIHKIEQTISAVPAQEFFAQALDMDVGAPTLQMVRRIFDSKGRLVDILYCHHNPRRFQFRLELDADEYHS